MVEVRLGLTWRGVLAPNARCTSAQPAHRSHATPSHHPALTSRSEGHRVPLLKHGLSQSHCHVFVLHWHPFKTCNLLVHFPSP